MTTLSDLTPRHAMHVELGFGASGTTGWGLIALHIALGLTREGATVHLPPESDLSAVPPTLHGSLEAMMTPVPDDEHAVRIDAYGNHWPDLQPLPNRTRVLFTVFEDTAIPDRACNELRKYDLLLTPSWWAHDLLAAKGVPSTVWHQGYDESLFTPTPRRRPNGPIYVFSGGKLEFRKGQDIAVEAFRRFRELPVGKDAVLVTAWQNRWPQTMDGIWASGYVKGIPSQRMGRNGPELDIVGWLEANGLPRESVIDLGFLSQANMANAIRECDVALFPNRCEGATNMQLPEVLGCGVPAIISRCCGHIGYGPVFEVGGATPVTLPCSLYKGMEGWGEADPVECVEKLEYVANLFSSPPSVRDPVAAAYAAEHFGWRPQCRLLADLLRAIPAKTSVIPSLTIPPTHRNAFPGYLTALGLTGVGVEVGTYAGDYAAHLLRQWPGLLHCVDPYLHQPGWDDLLNHDAAGFASVRAYAEAQLAPWVSGGRCVLHATTSVDAATQPWARALDFVYLDARHDYEHVLEDLRAWAPLVKPGGIIGGHDYLDEWIGPTHFEVKRAVLDWVAETGYDASEIHVTTDGPYLSWFLRIREADHA